MNFDSTVICREDDEADDAATKETPRTVSETEMNKIMAAREKKLLGQFEKRIQGMGFASSEQVDKLLNGLDDNPSGAGESSGANRQQIDEAKDDHALPPGVRAELSKLHKQMGKMSEDNKRLQEAAESKDHAMQMERRKHNTEALLSAAGAVRPEQCFKIINDQITSDEEIGDAITVKTSHGDDLVPVKDFIDTFKEDNPHLFSTPAKSGSGAGSGSSPNSKPRFTSESIRDQKQGGMSWEDYEANREKIISDLEQNKGS